MNLKYMKVSLFEISYKKKRNFFTIFKFFEMYLYIYIYIYIIYIVQVWVCVYMNDICIIIHNIY